MHVLSPSSLAVCAHHLSLRIAILLSLLSSVPNSSNVTSVYFPHLLEHVPILLVQFTFSHCEFYSRLHSTRVLPLPPDYWYVYLFLLSGRFRSATKKNSYSFFALSTGPFMQLHFYSCRYYLLLKPDIYLNVPPLSPYLLALAFRLLLKFLLLLS